MCLSDGLRNLQVLDAGPEQVTAVINYFRGFTDMQLSGEMMQMGWQPGVDGYWRNGIGCDHH